MCFSISVLMSIILATDVMGGRTFVQIDRDHTESSATKRNVCGYTNETQNALHTMTLTMVPPFGLFRVFITRFHVDRIIHWPLLLATAAEHRRYAEADGLYR